MTLTHQEPQNDPSIDAEYKSLNHHHGHSGPEIDGEVTQNGPIDDSMFSKSVVPTINHSHNSLNLPSFVSMPSPPSPSSIERLKKHERSPMVGIDKDDEDHLPEKASLQSLIDLKRFLLAAPLRFLEGDIIHQFRLPSDEQVSCVRWNHVYCITGTDIVRCLVHRFSVFGREILNRKKFEEGIFSDLRNLKINVDAILENPRSELLEFLYKKNCVRTKKKQKVFFWYSVHHERLFIDALERELKKEAAVESDKLTGPEAKEASRDNNSMSAASTVAVREPALSFKYDSSLPLAEQIPHILETMPEELAQLVSETTFSAVPTEVPHDTSTQGLQLQTDGLCGTAHALASCGEIYAPEFKAEGDYPITPKQSVHDASSNSSRASVSPWSTTNSNSYLAHSNYCQPVETSPSAPSAPSTASAPSVALYGKPLANSKLASKQMEPSQTSVSATAQRQRPTCAHNEQAPGLDGRGPPPHRRAGYPPHQLNGKNNHSHRRRRPKEHAQGSVQPRRVHEHERVWYSGQPSTGPLTNQDILCYNHKVMAEDTDFPLDVLVKEDWAYRRPLKENPFETRYTNFAYENRPALSLNCEAPTDSFYIAEDQEPGTLSSPFEVPQSNYFLDCARSSHQSESPSHPLSPSWDNYLNSMEQERYAARQSQLNSTGWNSQMSHAKLKTHHESTYAFPYNYHGHIGKHKLAAPTYSHSVPRQ